MGLFNGRVGVACAGFGLLGALCVTACGSSDKPSGPDFGALQKEYATPSGTLHAEDKAGIIAALNSQSAASSAPLFAGSKVGGNSKGSGPHVLGTGPSCGASSSQTAICEPCPGGGTITVSLGSESSSGVSGSESYNQCNDGTADESVVINGSVEFVEIINGDATDPSAITLIYSGSIDESVGSASAVHIDLNYSLIGGKQAFSVKVSDGNILVEDSSNWDVTTETGTFTIVTKDGTTSCTLTNGAGSCTGPGGNVTFS